MNRNHIIIRHILDETLFLIPYTKEVSYHDFLNNLPMKKAVVQSLLVIGEAANQTDKAFCKEYPEIDWRGMAGLRHRLIHRYFEINYALVWEIIENDIPELHQKIEHLCEICNDID
ncbi:MAG TPA: DUF86 domain-containing protein [Methanocorpusculum sp.]|nr:DUF86 domain-containing protein [Methanocorpusculum sp.]